MADRRDAADGIASGRPHEVRICACQRFTHFRGHLGFADSIVATCDNNDRLAACLPTKHDRLGDLGNRAANCGSCLSTGARWLFELDDLGIDPSLTKELRGADGSGVLGGPHWKNRHQGAGSLEPLLRPAIELVLLFTVCPSNVGNLKPTRSGHSRLPYTRSRQPIRSRA